MYPGGAPMSREIECFSEYSLPSILIIASGESNNNVANVLLSNVLPVPEGPAIRKLAMGL